MTLKRIWVTRKSSLFIALGATLGFAFLGNIMHDIIVRYVPDEEMTVFPLGSMLALGSAVFAFIFIGLLGGESFVKVLHMGGTRRRYYRDTVLSNLIIFTGILIIAELTFLFEQWKFRAVFPEYAVASEFSFMHNPVVLIVLLVAGTSFSLLLTALGLRFSISQIGIIVWVLFGLLGVGIGKFSDSEFFDTVIDSGNIVLAALSVLSLVAFVISYRLIMRQDAKV